MANRFIAAVLFAVALVSLSLPASSQPLQKFVLTSASATACTTLAVPGVPQMVLSTIINTGPAMAVFPQFFDDTKCSVPANVIYGDGSTIVLQAGQLYNFGLPLVRGLSYTLSGALPSTQNVVITIQQVGN